MGREGFIWFMNPHYGLSKGSQGGKPEAGTEAETMEDLCLQAARKKRKMSMTHVSAMLRVLQKLQKFTIILNESSAGWLMGTMKYRCESNGLDTDWVFVFLTLLLQSNHQCDDTERCSCRE